MIEYMINKSKKKKDGQIPGKENFNNSFGNKSLLFNLQMEILKEIIIESRDLQKIKIKTRLICTTLFVSSILQTNWLVKGSQPFQNGWVRFGQA